MTTTLTAIPIPTPDGTFLARYSEAGLARLQFPAGRTLPPRSGRRSATKPLRRWHRAVTLALRRALRGRNPGALPPLDLSGGTAFQRSVWNALRTIEPGRTRSYGEVARRLGRPGAARAVGGACGANPIPVFIPCHRVLAAKGRLGGFSGGLSWKRRLLLREGVQPAG